MGFIRTLWVITKTSTKLGLAGGAIYFTQKEGVWGNADETTALLKRLGPELPALNTVLPQSVIESVQSFTEKMELWANPNHKTLPEYWNDGVFVFIRTMDNLPVYAVSAKDKTVAWASATLNQSKSTSQSD